MHYFPHTASGLRRYFLCHYYSAHLQPTIRKFLEIRQKQKTRWSQDFWTQKNESTYYVNGIGDKIHEVFKAKYSGQWIPEKDFALIQGIHHRLKYYLNATDIRIPGKITRDGIVGEPDALYKIGNGTALLEIKVVPNLPGGIRVPEMVQLASYRYLLGYPVSATVIYVQAKNPLNTRAFTFPAKLVSQTAEVISEIYKK